MVLLVGSPSLESRIEGESLIAEDAQPLQIWVPMFEQDLAFDRVRPLMSHYEQSIWSAAGPGTECAHSGSLTGSSTSLLISSASLMASSHKSAGTVSGSTWRSNAST